LQEIGPRFTLKLRSLRKGIPAVQRLGENPQPLELGPAEAQSEEDETQVSEPAVAAPVAPPREDEYLWLWKVSDPAHLYSVSEWIIALA